MLPVAESLPVRLGGGLTRSWRESCTALRDQLLSWLPNEQFVTYCDTGPIMEKAWAQRAGVGWIGKNACLVTRGIGSWVFLGEIVTTAEIPPDAPHADFCGSCTRCIDACPTDAIAEPYVVDANRCIAYWTIEERGDIPADIAEQSDGWISGCDTLSGCLPVEQIRTPHRRKRISAAGRLSVPAPGTVVFAF